MAAALSYLAGVITGILFLVIDPFKADRFVRFHAFQSIFFNVAWIGLWIAWIIVGMVLGAITKGLFFIVQVPIDLLIMVGGFCLWAFLMYSASQSKTFKLPIIGAIAAKQAGLSMATPVPRFRREASTRRAGWHPWRRMLAILMLLGACKHTPAPSSEQPRAMSVHRHRRQEATDARSLRSEVYIPKQPSFIPSIRTRFPNPRSNSESLPSAIPSVDYQPGIILMENGDKAIKSVASDGMTWTFDANAPQVGDFQVGKVVFATSRAVGRVLSLNRQGNSVSVILGPIQLTDVILNGSFEMNQAVDLNNMISYVAPDYPEPPDPSAQTNTSINRNTSPDHVDESMILSRPSHGKWIPASMVRTYGDGRRVSYRKEGRFWSANTSYPNRMANGQVGIGFGGARLVRTR